MLINGTASNLFILNKINRLFVQLFALRTNLQKVLICELNHTSTSIFWVRFCLEQDKNLCFSWAAIRECFTTPSIKTFYQLVQIRSLIAYPVSLCNVSRHLY